MNELGLLLVTAALVAVVALAPLRIAFAALLTTIVLVPATLVVPNGFTPVPTITRVVLWTFALRVVVAVWRGRVKARDLVAGPVTIALGVFVALALLAGVVAAPATAVTWTGALRWLGYLDQFVFLAVALVAIRKLGPRATLTLIAGAAGAMVLVATVEQVTGGSWGAFLFSGVPEQFTEAARQLGTRAGRVRVKVGFEFPLEFGWVAVALVPPTILVATRRWREVWPVAVVALLPLSIYWSVTRTAAAAFLPVLVLVALLARDRRLALMAGGVVAVVAVTVLSIPGLIEPLLPGADVGAIAVREQRLPPILALAGGEPYLGLGLSGLQTAGFPTTDSSYLLLYAELGTIGLTAFVVAALTAIGAMARGLGTGGYDDRVVAVSLASCGALLTSAFTFDTFTTLGSAEIFWLLAAVGIVAAERGAGPVPFPRATRRRLAAPVVALAIGVALATLVPLRYATTIRLHTLPAGTEALGEGDPLAQGATVVAATCGLSVSARVPAAVRCTDVPQAAGVAQIRVEAGRRAAVARAVEDVVDRVRSELRAPHIEEIDVTGVRSGRPTAASTAPVWLPLLTAGVAALWPPRREHGRSPRRIARAQDRPVEPAT